VRSRSIGADIGAGFKAMAGGEIKTFTTLCEQTRREALTRMLEQAAERGANGVICIRYDTNLLAPGITEVLAYGLAVTDSNTPLRHEDLAHNATESEGIRRGYVCSSNELPGYTVHRSLGVVNGITVRSRNVGMAIGAVGKSLVGGEIRNWTKLCEDAREEAYVRMIAEASALGADGVVAMRYSTNEVKQGITEVVAYGTAVSSTPAASGGATTDASPGISMHMVTTSNSLPDLTVAYSYAVTRGISVQSSNIMRSIGAGFKSLVGGEIRNWTDLCHQTRAAAFEQMLTSANQLGAKGIIGMRYDATQVTDKGVVEVIAYGTAVSDQPLMSAISSLQPASLPQSAVTTDLHLPGHVANRSLGIVRGISVQSVHILRGIKAGLGTIIGGEISSFTRMCECARQEAYNNMLRHADEMGATGVVAMRFESNDLVPGVIEVVAYGTAVSDGSRAVNDSVFSAETALLSPSCISTTNEIIGESFQQSLGVVKGITCRSRNIFANFGSLMKSGFVGGEVRAWQTLCEQSRLEATDRLIDEAVRTGARGIVAVRYETNEISAGMTETIAYGTAVA
jgi:uncharacterized protein YbjQ (UPF0145 family)